MSGEKPDNPRRPSDRYLADVEAIERIRARREVSRVRRQMIRRELAVLRRQLGM
jgi:hypothetical protein